MNDFYFKFANKDLAIDALVKAGFTPTKNGEVFHNKAAIDLVGEIYNTKCISEEEETYEVEKVAGYHVNIRTWCPDLAKVLSKLPNNTKPATPRRVWA